MTLLKRSTLRPRCSRGPVHLPGQGVGLEERMTRASNLLPTLGASPRLHGPPALVNAVNVTIWALVPRPTLYITHGSDDVLALFVRYPETTNQFLGFFKKSLQLPLKFFRKRFCWVNHCFDVL